jgi:hypothetical protein
LLTISGPIVLVGHTDGGAVISNAAVGVPNVKALVYIAASAPDKGESLAKLVTVNPGTEIGPATLDFRQYPLADGGTRTDLYLKKSEFHDAFAGDLPLKVTDQMQATQRPFSNEAFQSPSGEPAWKTIPSWYMVATQDHAIPPVTERFMAARRRRRSCRRGERVTCGDDLATGSDDQTDPRRCPLGTLILRLFASPVTTAPRTRGVKQSRLRAFEAARPQRCAGRGNLRSMAASGRVCVH